MSDLVLEVKRVSCDIIEKGEGRGPGVLEPEPGDRGWILALRWSGLRTVPVSMIP